MRRAGPRTQAAIPQAHLCRHQPEARTGAGALAPNTGHTPASSGGDTTRARPHSRPAAHRSPLTPPPHTHTHPCSAATGPRRATLTPRATPAPVATPEPTPSPAAAASLRPGETPDQARERRLRESARVDERVRLIDSFPDFQAALDAAGEALVVLEVGDPEVCESGCQEADLLWKADAAAAAAAAKARCVAIKHTFARTARDCPDAVFLELDAGSEAGAAAAAQLGVSTLPTVQFWRKGAKVWEHAGSADMERDIGEGVLFYGDAAGGGLKPSDFVAEIQDRAGLDALLGGRPPGELVVLDVSTTTAAACIHIFPAVLALARNFRGYAAFGRLVADASVPASALTRELGVTDVPSFIFFRGGVEVGRHVGSSRGDLIGQILSIQSAAGVKPPPPPPRAGAGRR